MENHKLISWFHSLPHFLHLRQVVKLPCRLLLSGILSWPTPFTLPPHFDIPICMVLALSSDSFPFTALLAVQGDLIWSLGFKQHMSRFLFLHISPCISSHNFSLIWFLHLLLPMSRWASNSQLLRINRNRILHSYATAEQLWLMINVSQVIGQGPAIILTSSLSPRFTGQCISRSSFSCTNMKLRNFNSVFGFKS